MIPRFLNEFYQKNNLRPFECTFMIYVHVLALFGITYLSFRFDKALEVRIY